MSRGLIMTAYIPFVNTRYSWPKNWLACMALNKQACSLPMSMQHIDTTKYADGGKITWSVCTCISDRWRKNNKECMHDQCVHSRHKQGKPLPNSNGTSESTNSSFPACLWPSLQKLAAQSFQNTEPIKLHEIIEEIARNTCWRYTNEKDGCVEKAITDCSLELHWAQTKLASNTQSKFMFPLPCIGGQAIYIVRVLHVYMTLHWRWCVSTENDLS